MTKNSSERSHRLTVIVIGTKWGTLSFQVTRGVVISTALAVLLCVVLAAYGLVQITESGGKLTPQELTAAVRASKMEAQALKAENTTLREKLRHLENQFISIGQKPPQTETKQASPADNATRTSPDILIDQFRIRYADGGVHFQFNLKTAGKAKGRTTGYIFVVLPSDRSYPQTALNNGKPGNFKDGEHFGILHQKTIRGVIPKISNVKTYQRADVFIYSEEGALVYNTSFPLKDM